MYVCRTVQHQYRRMQERGRYSGPKIDAISYPPTTCYSNTAVQQMRWYKPSSWVVHPPTQQPTHPRRATAIQHYSSRCVGTNRVDVHWDFHFLPIPRHSGERAIRPREGLSTPPARRAGHRRRFFLRCVRGLLCGTGVEPPRGRSTPSGGWESQLSLSML